MRYNKDRAIYAIDAKTKKSLILVSLYNGYVFNGAYNVEFQEDKRYCTCKHNRDLKATFVMYAPDVVGDYNSVLWAARQLIENEPELEITIEPEPAKTLTLEEHQEKIGELYDADPNCWHELDPNCWSGVRCMKCRGWFCF